MRDTKSSKVKGAPVIRTEHANQYYVPPAPTVAISEGIGDDGVDIADGDGGVPCAGFCVTCLEVVSAMVPFSEFLTMQGGGTVIVAVFVNTIRVLNARRSTKHWFIGWVVFVACVGGYVSVGTMSYILAPMNPYFFVNGLSGFMFGLIAGNIIGAWIWKYYHKEIEREDDDA